MPPTSDVFEMTDAKYHTPEVGALEGRVFRPSTIEELAEAVELAFDYRGDVTLHLASAEQITGYIFNRSVNGPSSSLDLFPASGGERTIAYADIVSIAFTGEDTATGKSWEVWVGKKESDRLAERERVTADAKARGYL